MSEADDLKIKIKMEDAEFKRALSQSTNALGVASREFQKYSTSIENTGNKSGNLEAKSKMLNTQLTEQKTKLSLLGDQLQKVSEREGDTSRESQRLAKQMDFAQIATNKLEQELSEVKKELVTDRLEKYGFGLKQMSEEARLAAVNLNKIKFDNMKKFGDGLKDVGSKMTSFGQNMTTRVSLPLVAIGGLAVKAAVDFESAFAGVKKTVDATAPQLDVLKKGFMSLSKEIPISAVELAGIGESAGQLGIQTPSIMGFTRVMADLGVATNLTSEQAATALARMANITQMPQDQFDRLGSTIVALGNNLATTEAEIVEMGLRLSGAGSQIGMTEAQILGMSGALSSVGINAEAGGSAFSKIMLEIDMASASGANAVKDFADVAGMSAEEFQEKWKTDAAGAMTDFVEGLGKLEGSGENAALVLDKLGFSEIRARDALLRTAGAGDLLRRSIDLGTKSWDENNALTKEASQRYETTASQFQLLKNKLFEVGVTLGQALLPHLMVVADKVSEFASAFMAMDPATQGFIVNAGLIAIAVGPLLVGLGSVVGAVGSIVSTIGSVGGAIAGLGVATPVATAALGGLEIAAVSGGVASGGLLASLGGLSAIALPLSLAVVGTGLAIWGIHEVTKQTDTEVKFLNETMDASVLKFDSTAKALEGGTQSMDASMRGFGGHAESMVTASDLADEASQRQVESMRLQREAIADYSLAYGDIVKTYEYVDTATGEHFESTNIVVSDGTLKMRNEYHKLSLDVNTEFTTMWATNEKVTQEKADSILSKTNGFTNKTVEAFEKQRADSTASIQKLKDSGLKITDEQHQAMLDKSKAYYDKEIKSTQDGNDRITDIISRAKNENREITIEEKDVISKIRGEADQQSIKAITKNYAEQTVLLESLSSKSETITTEMLEDTVQKMNKTRDDAVKAAQEKHVGVMRALVEQKDVSKTISDEEYQILKKSSEDITKSVINEAEKARTGGLDKLSSAHSQTMNDIDTETGKTKSVIDKFATWWNNLTFKNKTATVTAETNGNVAGSVNPGPASYGASPQSISTFALAENNPTMQTGVSKATMRSAKTYSQTISNKRTNNTNASVINGGITFNIIGNESPKKVADEVFNEINRRLGMEV